MRKKIVLFVLCLAMMSQLALKSVNAADIPKVSPGNTQSTAYVLSAGNTIGSESKAVYFEAKKSETYWFKFTVTKDQASGVGSYSEVSYKTSTTSILNAVLYDSALNKIKQFGYQNSGIYRGILGAGTYYFKITLSSGADNGNVTIYRNIEKDDAGNSSSNATKLTNNRVLNKKAQISDDVDWFKFVPTTDEVDLTISNSASNGLGVIVYRNDLTVISNWANWSTVVNPNTNKTVRLSVNKNSTYYVKVNTVHTRAGKYTIKYTDIKNGFLKDTDGKWKYFKDGKVDTTYNKLAKNQYGWHKVTKGIYDPSYTGVAQNAYGWFYVNKGKVDLTYTGLVKRPENGNWYYVENGKINWNYNDLAKNSYGWHKVTKGQVDFSYTGVAKNKYGWFYVRNGKVDQSVTGVVKRPENGRWYYVSKGKLDWNFTGIAKNPNNGKSFYVTKGEINWKYTGSVTFNGKRYNITKGEVK